MTYNEFRNRIAENDTFVEKLWQADSVWNLDLDIWALYIAELYQKKVSFVNTISGFMP